MHNKRVLGIISIASLATVAVVTIAFGLYREKFTSGSRAKTADTEETGEPLKVNYDADDYTNETCYTGKMEDYPELYAHPFKKTDVYVSNRELTELDPDRIKVCNDAATTFMNRFFNINYRDISSDESGYVISIMDGCAVDAFIQLEDRDYPLYDYVYDICDFALKNETQVEAEFITDSSLVYQDYYTYVRGMLKFTVFSCNSKDIGANIGEETLIPMEVALSDQNGTYTICSFGQMQ